MQLDTSVTEPELMSSVLMGAIVPRPIAWVSSVDELARPNLAPFSFFNLISVAPPVVVFSCAPGPGGQAKDTLKNVRRVPEFVHNVATEALVNEVEESSLPLPRGVSEAARCGLELVASERVRPPRVARSSVSMECKVVGEHAVGEAGVVAVFGEVELVHIADEVLTVNGQLSGLRALGRVGNGGYCTTTSLLSTRGKGGRS